MATKGEVRKIVFLLPIHPAKIPPKGAKNTPEISNPAPKIDPSYQDRFFKLLQILILTF